jgi:hypothetical protein
VIEVHVGHDDEPDRPPVNAAAAELRGQVLAGLELWPRQAGDPPSEVLRRLRGNRGMEPGVDDERPRRRVPDQEGGHGKLDPARAPRPETEHAQARQPRGPLDVRAGSVEAAAEDRLDDDR